MGFEKGCPCCKMYKDGLEFKQVMQLEEAGLVIYHHTTAENSVASVSQPEKAFNAKDNVFIIHNTKNRNVTISNYMSELEQAINCPRCKYIVKHTKELLANIPFIKKEDVIGICDHCRFTKRINERCVKCQVVVKDFLKKKEQKQTETRASDKPEKAMISKIQHILKDVPKDIFDIQKKTEKYNQQLKKGYLRHIKTTELYNNKSDSEITVTEAKRPQEHHEPRKKVLFNSTENLPWPGSLQESEEFMGLDNKYQHRLKQKLKPKIDADLPPNRLPSRELEEYLKRESYIFNPVDYEAKRRPSEETDVHKKENIKKYQYSYDDIRDSKYDHEISKSYDDIHHLKYDQKFSKPSQKKEDIFLRGIQKQTRSVHSIRRHSSEETLVRSASATTEHTLRKDFSFYFIKESDVAKKPPLKRVSSSELIKDTQDMYRARAEEERIKKEQELKEKFEAEEKKRLENIERKKHLEEERRLEELKKKKAEDEKKKIKADEKFTKKIPSKHDTESQEKSVKSSKDTLGKSRSIKLKTEIKESKIDKSLKSDRDSIKSKKELDRQEKEESIRLEKERKLKKKLEKEEQMRQANEEKQRQKEEKEKEKANKKEQMRQANKEKQRQKEENEKEKANKEEQMRQANKEKQRQKEEKEKEKANKEEQMRQANEEKQRQKDEKEKANKEEQLRQANEEKQRLKEEKEKGKANIEKQMRQTNEEKPRQKEKEKEKSNKEEQMRQANEEKQSQKEKEKEKEKANKEEQMRQANEEKQSQKEEKEKEKANKEEQMRIAKEEKQRQKEEKEKQEEQLRLDKEQQKLLQREKEQRLKEKEERQKEKEEQRRPKVENENISKDIEKPSTTKQNEEQLLAKPIKDKESKLRKKEEAEKKKEAHFKLKSLKENKVVEEPEPPPIKKIAEESKMKDLNINQVIIRKDSPDDLILRLVKLKQKRERIKETPTRLRKILRKHAGHKNKSKSCIICLDSELALDIENIRMNETKPKEVADIIIGTKIFKYKPSLLTKKKEKEIKPLLFTSTHTEEAENMIKAQGVIEIKAPETEKPPIVSAKNVEQDVHKGIIRYALSDRTFIEKGWTMLPTEKVVRKMNVYRMRPAHPEFDWFEHNKNRKLICYDTGEKLAEFNDSGKGRWFYRSGKVALDYYDAEEINAQHRIIIFSSGEPDERGCSRPFAILATFDYLGNGIVFDHSGKIRLKYNQTEGVVLDRAIGPVSHWKWHTLNDPPVLQQVMIDTQMAHKDPEIIKLGGQHDNNPRPDNEEMLAIEFDNFIKEKSKKLSQKFKPFQIKMKALKINEYFSLKVLDQATIYLIYRDGSTNLKLNIGMILDHQEIVDTDTAEVGEVSNSVERFPARTDSLAALQRSVAHAQRVERAREERAQRLRPSQPCSSADRLTAGLSRPPPARTDNGSCPCRKPSTFNLYYNTRLI